MLMNKLSRRGFVQVLTATAAVSALPSWVAASTKVPAKWDEAVDVVIIGSGFAGLAAAYEAKKAGATVALLEKMRVAAVTRQSTAAFWPFPVLLCKRSSALRIRPNSWPRT